MKSIRTTAAGVALAFAVAPTALAACGSQPASPEATPATTQAPVPGATSSAPSIRVVSSRVAYPWHWPNDVARPGRVAHAYPVPPVPELVQISVGDHPADHGQLPYNPMSFT